MAALLRRAAVPQRGWPIPFLRILGVESAAQARKALFAYLFVSPWLIGLLVFYVGPVIASFYFSLNEYDIISPPRWLGLANYEKAFLKDDLFWPSLGRTMVYAAVSVPLGLIGSLLLAVLLNQGLSFTNVYRTMFFLPHLTPAVALSVLWVWILHPVNGPVNSVLKSVGIR